MTTPNDVTAAFEPQAASAPPLRSVGNYDLEAEIARGGMGVVYRARQRGLNRVVALKMILTGGQAGPTERARFRAEAEAVALLAHPHIVRVIEIGEQDGQLYQALEFCPGGTLTQRLAGKPLPAPVAAALVEKLARAMQAAHTRGILHRDLKPSNVLFDEQGEPRVADFGLAKLTDRDDGSTRTGTILGTPSYMAPEQARGDATLGPACDIYALGAILYECLTGQPPFRGETVGETLEQVRTREPVAPRTLNRAVPRDLETVCLKCLRKEPEKRYASAAEFADDLERYRTGRPVQARPVGALERSWRWCRRNPLVAALSVLTLFLLVGVAIGATLTAFRLFEANTQVNQAREETAQQLKDLTEANRQLEDAQGHIAQGRWPEALAAHTAAIEAMPNLAEVRRARGRFYYRLGLYPEALADLAAARALQPSLDPRTWHLEALLCRLTGDEASYDLLVAASLEQFPAPRTDELAAWLLRLHALRLDRPDPALRSLGEQARHAGDAWTNENFGIVRAYLVGDQALITPLNVKTIPAHEAASRLALEVVLRRERQQPQEAHLAFTALGKHLTTHLGTLLAARVDLGTGPRWPRDFDTRSNAGYRLTLRERLDLLHGRDVARLLAQSHPVFDQLALIQRATGFQLLGQHAAALPVVEQAVALTQPPDVLLRIERCRLLATLEDEGTSAALGETVAFLKANRPKPGEHPPHEAAIFDELSRLYENQGDLETAAEVLAYDTSVRRERGFGEPIEAGWEITDRAKAVLLRRGQLLARAEKWDAAAKAYRTLLGQLPPEGFTLAQRPICAEIAESEQLFQRVTTVHDYAGKQLTLARAVYLLDQGDRAGAVALVQKVLRDRDPDRLPLTADEWLGRELAVTRALIPLVAEVWPRDGFLWFNLANTRLEQHDAAGAATALGRGLDAVARLSTAHANAVRQLRRQAGAMLAQHNDLFDAVLAARPGDAAVWLARLSYQLDSRDGKAAGDTLGRAWAALPDSVEFAAGAAPLLVAVNYNVAARRCLDQWSRLRPDEPECWVLRADLSHAENKMRDAAQELSQAIDLYEKRGELGAARGLKHRIMTRGPAWQEVGKQLTALRTQDGDLLEAQAIAAIQSQRPQDAPPLFLEAARRKQSATLFALAGEGFLGGYNRPPGALVPPAAADAFAQALRLAPERNFTPDDAPAPLRQRIAENDNLFTAVAARVKCGDPWLWLARGWHLHTKKRFDEADAAFERLLEAAPVDPFARFARSMYFLQRANPERSLAEAEIALNALPSAPLAFTLRRVVYSGLVRDPSYAKLLALRPNDLHLRGTRAVVIFPDRELLTEVLTLAPNDPYLRYLRAMRLATAGQWTEAEADFVFLAGCAGIEGDVAVAEEIALGLMRLGKVREYEEFRARLLARGPAPSDSGQAQTVAFTCCLTPLPDELQTCVRRLRADLRPTGRFTQDQANMHVLIDLHCGGKPEATRLFLRPVDTAGNFGPTDVVARLLRVRLVTGAELAEAKQAAQAALARFRTQRSPAWKAVALIEALARGLEP